MKKFLSIAIMLITLASSCNKNIEVIGVTLNHETLILSVSETETLKATVLPADATNKELIWKSSNPNVVSVDNTGKITALAADTATITVTTVDGGKKAGCVVTVKEELANLIFNVNGVSFKMIYVESGTFTMGRTSDFWPAHEVTLTQDYYIGEIEVTQALWYEVTGYKPIEGPFGQWQLPALGDNYPAYYVRWDDVQYFITKLNEITGKNFRLPTEAEWEFAARGGKKSRNFIYSGSNNIDEVAHYGYTYASEVKTLQANELGIYDMSGNVWEWCQDWFGEYNIDPQTNPTGPETGVWHVNRGGGYNSLQTLECRVYYRNSNPNVQPDIVATGFRLALFP